MAIGKGREAVGTMKFFQKPVFSDVRFWILLFGAVRLIGITDPPLEAAESWRQSTVLMVARNFHELGPDLLHPRIDFAGDKTGITGMEFPLLNYLIYRWHRSSVGRTGTAGPLCCSSPCSVPWPSMA